jgi:penicillin G amidase
VKRRLIAAYPGENFVWADRDGNIGYQAVGVAPLRPNWDGLLPVPGDGRYEWDGYLPILALPNATNPQQGFWNTSNESLVPDNYPFRNAVGWTWTDPYRSNRVREVLASGQKFNLQDMAQLQNDSLIHTSPHSGAHVEWSGAWQQCRCRAGSSATDSMELPDGYRLGGRRYLYGLGARIASASVSIIRAGSGAAYIGLLQMKPTVDRLLSPDGRFGTDPTAGRNQLAA